MPKVVRRGPSKLSSSRIGVSTPSSGPSTPPNSTRRGMASITRRAPRPRVPPAPHRPPPNRSSTAGGEIVVTIIFIICGTDIRGFIFVYIVEILLIVTHSLSCVHWTVAYCKCDVNVFFDSRKATSVVNVIVIHVVLWMYLYFFHHFIIVNRLFHHHKFLSMGNSFKVFLKSCAPVCQKFWHSYDY